MHSSSAQFLSGGYNDGHWGMLVKDSLAQEAFNLVSDTYHSLAQDSLGYNFTNVVCVTFSIYIFLNCLHIHVITTAPFNEHLEYAAHCIR